MGLTFTLDPCEGCSKTVQQNVSPETIWVRQDPPAMNIALTVCKTCKKRVMEHNAPYEAKEREADVKAKAIMDAKLAAEKKTEDAKANREQNVMEALAQQNQMILLMLSKLTGIDASSILPAPPPPEPAPEPEPEPAPPEPPKPAVPGLDQIIGKPIETTKRRARRKG